MTVRELLEESETKRNVTIYGRDHNNKLQNRGTYSLNDPETRECFFLVFGDKQVDKHLPLNRYYVVHVLD